MTKNRLQVVDEKENGVGSEEMSPTSSALTKEEIQGILTLINRASVQGGEVESVAHLKAKLVDMANKG